jgi:hypothetical protein
MVFTIKKGKHYSNNLFHKICNLLNFNKSVSYLVKFDESCTYSLPKEDQGDINKLFGTSIGLHHKNSVRFGWCWLNNKLKLYAYWYDNGVRKSKEIQNIEINKKYFLTIENLDTQWKFVVIGFTDDSKKELIVEKSKTKINFGYRLWPYFGGNQVAPHQVNIELIDFNE